MNSKFYLICSLLLLLYNHVKICNSAALLGNEIKETLPNEFPFIISLGRKNHKGPRENHFCGGALVSKLYILTAAHCINKEDIKNVCVMIGSNDLQAGHKYDVNKWITFNDWADESDNFECGFIDAAMVKLVTEVREDIKFGITSKLDEFGLHDKKVITAGWGFVKSSDGTLITPRYLQKVELKVIKRRECLTNIHTLFGHQRKSLPGNLICSIGNPKAIIACGDSGSPLLDENEEIVAVNSATCPEEIGHDLNAQNLHVGMEHIRFFIIDVMNSE